ncbi:MAG TPA: M48 family peptidase [Acidiferrobacteraceae bacterium]|nr:M48 family peptidase [Acidiferrobacteraceae bacterium]HEX20591.1 M48 family peptidase [Acidiferrobacteraceae bacterium]
MNQFTLLFLFFLALATGIELWLAWRHIRHVRSHRKTVPDTFSEKISLQAHQKAADYTVSKTSFGLYEKLFGVAILLIWTLGGGLQWLDTFWRQQAWGDVLGGAAFILSVFLITGLLSLPASLYETFVIEQRYGFNKTTLKLFITDLVKQTVLILAIGAPLLMLALWLMGKMGTYWWLYLWVVWIGFSLFMVWAYPTLIAPLFNKFKPLDNDSLLQRINALLNRTGFKSNGVFIMDGSKRSAHGNAYFTGFGKSKRIVFFDTLLKNLSDKEVEAVLAHELGHFKHHHILKRILVTFILSLLSLAVLGWLVSQPWFYSGLGMSQASNHAALMLFILVGPVFTFLLSPVFSWSSRKHEFEADNFAVKQTDARELVNALVKLYSENANTLTPDPLHSVFYDSHPPAPVRVSRLLAHSS